MQDRKRYLFFINEHYAAAVDADPVSGFLENRVIDVNQYNHLFTMQHNLFYVVPIKCQTKISYAGCETHSLVYLHWQLIYL